MTTRRKLTITTASLLLVIASLYFVFMPALWRARCGAFPLMVATRQRAIAQENQIYLDKHRSAPPSVIQILFENRISFEDAYCWDLKDADFRIGSISLDDLLSGRAGLADLEAEITRLQFPKERWETFGPIAFLLRNPSGQFRGDVPIAVAILGERFASIQVGYEDGHAASVRRTNENITQLIHAIAESDIPPLPQEFLSQIRLLPDP